ncbi:MAG: hypothetical protein IJ572_00310 [Bacilli bacterium]|nr:hypothetical protein [Bacilli bacterium]
MELFYKEFSRGTTASIKKKNNIVYKKYFVDTPISMKVDKELFDILKEINHKNFLSLLKIRIINDYVVGYTYKYVKSDDIKITEKDTSYTLDNLRDLEKLVDIFNQSKILMCDTHAFNMITQKDNIVIIDPDSYQIDNKRSYEDFVLGNKIRLLSYIKNLYVNCCKKYDEDYYLAILKIFNIDLRNNLSLSNELSKRLTYKKPIDAIKKIKKSI